MTTTQRYTIDASVFLNGFIASEVGHHESSQFLAHVRQTAAPVIVPTLLFPEVAATISRVQGDGVLAKWFAATLRKWPQLTVIPVDDPLAQQAVDVAARFHLRGSDAVYVAVAIRFGTTLVTLDQERRLRAAETVVSITPAEALASV
jgi:predicted nucleic acid-binding protein